MNAPSLWTRVRAHLSRLVAFVAALPLAQRLLLLIMVATLLIALVYLFYTRVVRTFIRPTRRRLREAVSRLTRDRPTTGGVDDVAVAGSGPSANATKADDILATMREFHDVATDHAVVFVERAQAMVWLSQLYRVGWGPYRRNTGLAQRWAQAAGIRFRPDSDLDLLDADDRPHELPVYEPPKEVLQIPEVRSRSNSTTSSSTSTSKANVRALTALQRLVDETERQVLNHQNVHNSGVTGGVHETLSRFSRLHPHAQGPESVEQNVRQIRALLHAQPESDRKHDALRVLDRMESSTTPLVRSQLTEAQILSILWERRHDLRVDDQQAIDLLADRLADSVENGNIVCTTGRVTHAVDMWSGVDDTVRLQTKEQEKQERLRRVQELSQQSVALMHPNDQRRWNEGDQIDDLRKRVTDHVLSQMPMQATGHADEIRTWIDSL